MSDTNGQRIIISLGGSLVVPDAVDAVFVSHFKKFISERIGRGYRFIIVVGGGKVCRRYQEALEVVTTPSNDDKDWLGIATTRLNAEFMRIAFGELADTTVVTDPTLPIMSEAPVVFAAGWKPGWSTDYDAVMLAKQFGATKVINLSNIDYAYDKDPKQFPDAKRIEDISWRDFLELIPVDWDPGLSSPFDPVASRLAAESGIEVAVMNGKNIDNLQNYLDGKAFVGTRIK